MFIIFLNNYKYTFFLLIIFYNFRKSKCISGYLRIYKTSNTKPKNNCKIIFLNFYIKLKSYSKFYSFPYFPDNSSICNNLHFREIPTFSYHNNINSSFCVICIFYVILNCCSWCLQNFTMVSRICLLKKSFREIKKRIFLKSSLLFFSKIFFIIRNTMFQII